MRFEKWQALGNDYAVIEERELPFELTPERIRAFCAPHTGMGSDGILLLSEPAERGFVAALRIFNPDGSEAELSGNGVREAAMYLRRTGWTDADSFSIATAAGEVRPRITGATTCTVDMGRATLSSKDYPRRPGRRHRNARLPRGASSRSSTSPSATRSAPSRSREGLEELDLAALGPADREPRAVSRTARTSPSGAASRTTPSPRASSSAGWGRRCPRARVRPGRAVAAVLRGLDSPVTVRLDGGELEVEVGEDLHVSLTGWAVPVYRGELSLEFLAALKST